MPARALVDSGADISILSGRLYDKISRGTTKKANMVMKRIYTANAAPLKIETAVDVEVKINGLQIPFAVSVIRELNYDVILGVDFLNHTKAVIDVSRNCLSLYDGLLNIPMTICSNQPLAKTIAAVTISALSEAVFPVRIDRRLGRGYYMIEDSLCAPTRGLLVARTLVDPASGSAVCRVLNITDRPIKLKAHVAVGALTSVNVSKQISSEKHCELDMGELPTVKIMKDKLIQLGLTFEGTALTGEDFDNLVTMLYRNRDLVATDLKQLPGTDVLLHRIDTGSHPPVKKRSYRHSPQDRAEIARQVAEMHEAGIIEPSDSPWGSPVLLVSKPDGTKRFCIDYRELNSITSMTSFPLPSLDEILDTVAEQHPTLWTSLDLKSGYWQTRLDPATADRTAFEAGGELAVSESSLWADKWPPLFSADYHQSFTRINAKDYHGLYG